MASLGEKFKARGLTLIKGLQLVVEHGLEGGQFDNERKAFLKGDLDEIGQQYEKNAELISSFSFGQHLLNKLVKTLIQFCKTELIIKERIAFDILESSQYFAVWHEGRETIKTDFNQNDWSITQTELPISALAFVQQREFYLVGHKDFPDWCRVLPVWQQNYMAAQLKGAKNEETDARLKTIPADLRSIAGLANYTKHQLTLQKGEGSLKTQSERFRSATLSPIDVSSKIERQRLTKQNVWQVVDRQLDYVAKKFLEKWQPEVGVEQVLRLPIAMQTLLSPVWLDNFLGPIFYPSHNESRMLADKEYAVERVREKLSGGRGAIEVSYQHATYRIDPRVISTNYPVNFLRRETTLLSTRIFANSRNAAYLIRNAWHFIQDVIAPKFMALEDDTAKKYYLDLCKALSKQLKVFMDRGSVFFALAVFGAGLREFQQAMNHCLNALNLNYLTKKNPSAAAALKKTLNPTQLYSLRLLMNALRDYIVIYNTPRKWIHRNKELFLASLEQIITEQLGGIAYGSCTDGRYRKAVELMNTDAMLIYQRRYGVLPRYQDNAAQRTLFAEILTDLFFTHHQQKVAGQNMPGSEGIKGIIVLPLSPGMHLLPNDVVRMIKRRRKHEIVENERHAKLKKLRHPFKLFLQPVRWVARLAT